MLLFEKSIIGTYCNRPYDLKESHSSFSCHAKAELKQIAQAKFPNTTDINTKKGMLLNHFVVALINVCAVKLAQLH